VVAHVVAQDREPILEDALDDRAAHLDRPAGGGVPLQADDRGDLPRPRAGQEDRPALGRDDVVDRLEQPALDRRDAADRVDGGRDPEQNVEVAGRPVRGGRQLDRAARDDPLVLQLDRRPGRGGLGLVRQEQEDRGPDADLIAVLQPALLHRDTVDEGAVVAAEVGEDHPGVALLEQAVAAGDRHLLDADLVPRVASNRRPRLVQGDDRALLRPRHGGQFRIHVGLKYTQSDSETIRSDSDPGSREAARAVE
jgi:hypothetical protein